MDAIQTEQRVRKVIARDLGERAARHAHIERIETAHVVQLWERDGARRYTAIVDGPEQLDLALSESREPFGTDTAAVYRRGRLASVPSALAERVESVLVRWGGRTAVDVRHAIEPVAVVRAQRRRFVIALGQGRVLRIAERRPVTSLSTTLASIFLSCEVFLLCFVLRTRTSLSDAWPFLLAITALGLAALWVATTLDRQRERNEA